LHGAAPFCPVLRRRGHHFGHHHVDRKPWSPRYVYRMMGLPQRVQRTWMKVVEAAGNAWIVFVFVDKATLTASCGTIS